MLVLSTLLSSWCFLNMDGYVWPAQLFTDLITSTRVQKKSQTHVDEKLKENFWFMIPSIIAWLNSDYTSWKLMFYKKKSSKVILWYVLESMFKRNRYCRSKINTRFIHASGAQEINDHSPFSDFNVCLTNCSSPWMTTQATSGGLEKNLRHDRGRRV